MCWLDYIFLKIEKAYRYDDKYAWISAAGIVGLIISLGVNVMSITLGFILRLDYSVNLAKLTWIITTIPTALFIYYRYSKISVADIEEQWDRISTDKKRVIIIVMSASSLLLLVANIVYLIYTNA